MSYYCHTEDNVMILHTLFQKYVKLRKKKLYIAFLDFSKFFDCINRDSLFYTLQKCGILGNAYNLIKSAYKGGKYCIKTNFGVTESFISTSGVKQGCTLSPTFSNIYQNDIHEMFDNNCDLMDLDGIWLNSLSWAEDLVFISTSKNGLRKCLNNLSEYCNKWDLTINIHKTKVMVLSTGNAYVKCLLNDIQFNNDFLECVST